MELTKRQTIHMSAAAQARLGDLAKRYKLTRAEIISTILETLDEAVLAASFKARRDEKVEARTKTKEEREEARKLLKALGPEELKALMKQAGIEK